MASSDPVTSSAPVAPDGSGRLGNTNQPASAKRKRCNAAKRWCFTWNNYPENWVALLAPVMGSDHEWIFGKEKAPTTGTPHIQGYVEFPKKCRPLEKGLPKQIIWEACNGNRAKNVKYCSKEGDYICSPGCRPPRELPTIELYGWQVDALAAITADPTDRSILWYWSKEGGRGKSSLVKYLFRNHNAIVCSGKAADMMYMIVKYEEKHGNYPDIVIFDVPRSSFKWMSYGGMESIKNGLFASSKYETAMVEMPVPQVVVFCNYEPDYDNVDLSVDRLVVTNVDSE